MTDKEWLVDPDSGPVVWGFSPSGNAYAVGAARANGRFDQAWPLSAQVLAAAWPLPNGRWLGARILSVAARIPWSTVQFTLWLPLYAAVPVVLAWKGLLAAFAVLLAAQFLPRNGKVRDPCDP